MPDIVVQPFNRIKLVVEDSSKLKFTWRGSWLPETNYSREDVVRFRGNVHIALRNHNSGISFNSSNWDIMIGASSSGGDIFYEHIQSVAVADWVITHNIGKYPSVTVVDSSGSECEGNVNYINENQLIVSFSAPFSGVAYLN